MMHQGPVITSTQGSSTLCRYGTGCRRTDCKFYHPNAQPQYQQPTYPQYGQQQQQLCRFGDACFSQTCPYFHPNQQLYKDNGPEFTREEEEFMDEILDMIEHEQQLALDGDQDSEDERNINEIYDFIDQHHSQTVFESEYLLPEEAERDYQAMMAHHQQANDTNAVLDSMGKMSIKGMSATAPAFVPKKDAPAS
jgi:hypothetical protein